MAEPLQQPPLPLAAERSVEVVAPAMQGLRRGERRLTVFGFEFRIERSTVFVEAGRRLRTRPRIAPGQWVRVRGRTTIQGVLIARRVELMEEDGLLFVSVTRDGQEKALMSGGQFARRQPIQTFLEDDQKNVAFSNRLRPGIWLGGKAGQTLRYEDERDLDRERPADRLRLRSDLRLDVLWRIGRRGGYFLGETALRHEASWKEERALAVTTSADLARGYVFFPVTGVVGVQLGRQDFTDERQWSYDALLDGVRGYVVTKRFLGEVGVARGPRLPGGTVQRGESRFVTMDLRWYVDDRHFLGLWGVRRDTRAGPAFNPRLYGLRMMNRARRGLRYWLEWARASGRVNAAPIDGVGVDLGAAWITGRRRRFYVIGAVAYGSGVTGNDQSRAFRQTGIQRNTDKFGGVSRYRYYGEVLDPELSNRWITTLGVGMRPGRAFSVDVLWHGYQQVELSADLGNTRLKSQVNGRSRELGQAVDVVIGVALNGFKLEVTAGRFEPGAAFDSQVPSHVLTLQAEYKF